MILNALPYLPALLLPLVAQMSHMPTVWLFVAAAAGFTLPPFAQQALTALGANQSGSVVHDMYYVGSPSLVDASAALVFAVLGMVQFLKAKLDREDRRLTAGLFWTLLIATLGNRLITTVAIPAVSPKRYVDFPAALRPWDRANAALLTVSLAALAALIALMVLVPLIRRARRSGDR